jgi:DNA ligase-associated metallophosphoesterase
MEIEIRGHHFVMLHQKALYWREQKTLLIADLHLGKITHFRRAGIALPAVAHANNLQRLDELIAAYPIDRLYLLGDLFHHEYNSEWDRFVTWRAQYASIDCSIMLGNHDRLPHHMLSTAEITINTALRESGFCFTHHPAVIADPNEYLFCGHVHPVFSLRSGNAPTLRLPCFVFDASQAILPSFGVFTGGYEVSAMPGRKIFVIGEKEVFRV